MSSLATLVRQAEQQTARRRAARPRTDPTGRRRAPGSAPARVMVAESGIRDARDSRELAQAGVDAVLVGELLMRADNPGATIKELIA